MSTPAPLSSLPLQDPRGCLTEAGLQALRSAAAGRAPAELARHLAECVRCQERVLAVDAPRRGARRRTGKAEVPSVGRAALWALLVLLAMAAALVTLRQLTGS